MLRGINSATGGREKAWRQGARHPRDPEQDRLVYRRGRKAGSEAVARTISGRKTWSTQGHSRERGLRFHFVTMTISIKSYIELVT